MLAEAMISWVVLADARFERVDDSDGIVLETRPVAGSDFEELRGTATSPLTVAALCNAAYDDSRAPSASPEVKQRQVLSEKPDERVTYDQIAAPLVSDRDYAFRIRRQTRPDGSCQVVFETANELAPPLKPGWVRLAELHGSWTFESAPGGTRITYLVHTDPGGSLPSLVVRSGTRKSIFRSIKRIEQNAAAH